MPTYRVTWEIDVDASNPLEAALMAERFQKAQINEPGNGGVFAVSEMTGHKHVPIPCSHKDVVWVDLMEYRANEVAEEDGEDDPSYLNSYHCPDCDIEWQYASLYVNSDRCPRCDNEIEPYKCEDAPEN